MNATQSLQHFIASENPGTLEQNLSSLLGSLRGESLNDFVALILSEILSPGSQNIQQQPLGWFTPAAIGEAGQRGMQISNAFTKLGPSAINWNRVFNLMSTKYFLNRPISVSLASLNSLLAALNRGRLIDQFLGCDWNVQFKLNVCLLFHKWNIQQGCIDLLSMPDIKKVSSNPTNTSPKSTLLYLKSVARLDLEIFLLREELTGNPMLPVFQECFFEDYNSAPEYLALAVVTDIKHFTMIVDNKVIVDDLITTLLVKVVEQVPMALSDLIKQIAFEKVVELGVFILQKDSTPLSNFVQVLAEENMLKEFILALPFKEALKVTPVAKRTGWTGFQEFMKANLSKDTVDILLDFLELHSKMDESNTPFYSSKVYDLSALHYTITLLIAFPLTPKQRDTLENIQFSLLIAFPRLINFGFGHDKAILANGDLVPIPLDVEKEMQNYLQRMYSGELAIKDVIEVLRKLAS